VSTKTSWIPDEPASKEELLALVARMRAVSNATYDLFFTTGMGGDVHAFIEFCGVLSKYVDICERCAEQGIDFRLLNTHSGRGLPVEVHDMRYLGEKLDCILGPAIHANPAASAALREALFRDDAFTPAELGVMGKLDPVNPKAVLAWLGGEGPNPWETSEYRLAMTLQLAEELRRDGYHVIVRDRDGRIVGPTGMPEG